MAAGTAQPAPATPEPPRVHDYYTGRIGTYPIRMVLSRHDTLLGGVYAYSGRKSALQLQGRVASDGAFKLYESADPFFSGNSKHATGILEGRLSGDSLSGSWSGMKGAKRLLLSAARYKPDKRTVLTEAVGEFRLVSASGSMGANGMFDYWLEKGKWEGGSSSISQGQREGSETDFTPGNRALLNRLRVIVRPDLAVEIALGRKALMRIPFDPDRMHHLANREKRASSWRPNDFYRPDLTFFGDELAIAHVDSADFSPDLDLLNEELYMNFNDRMILDFRPIHREFRLKLGEVFDTAELTFKP